MKLRRHSTSLLILLAAAVPAAASPAQRSPSGERALATLEACHADPVQTARFATFGGEMTQIKLGRSMAVRFELYERKPGGVFRPVAIPAPGFDVWHPSAPGVGLLRYSQEVANLPAPADFRVQASYRWLNAHRHVIRRARRTTPVCVMPDERPNLVAGAITLRGGPAAGTMLYDVVVRNDGLGTAGPFAVVLSVGGQALPATTLFALAPSGREVLSFSGPRCVPGSTVTATLDPPGAIDQITRADDVRSITC